MQLCKWQRTGETGHRSAQTNQRTNLHLVRAISKRGPERFDQQRRGGLENVQPQPGNISRLFKEGEGRAGRRGVRWEDYRHLQEQKSMKRVCY